MKPLFSHMSRRHWKLAALSVALLTLTAVWLFLVRRPIGRDDWMVVPNSFYWPLSEWARAGATLCFFGGLAAMAAYDRFRRAKTRKEQTNSTILSILMLMGFATVWPWALLGPGGGQNMVYSFWSDISNEYFATAYQIDDPRAFARDYPRERQQPTSVMTAHVATHPPGAVLFFYGARRIYESVPTLQKAMTAFAEWLIGANLESVADEGNNQRLAAARSAGQSDTAVMPPSAVQGALLAMLLCSLALGLAVPAIYWMASGPPFADTNNEARGLFAAALFAFAPTVGLYAFTLDAVIACGAAWMLACVAHSIALRRQPNRQKARLAWLAVGGLILGLTSFLSFGALASGAIAVLALFFVAWHEMRNWPRNFARDVSLLALGCGGAWLLLMLFLPMEPLTIYRNAMHWHHWATLQHRSDWRLLNLLCFALFCGWPVVTSSVAAWRVQNEGQGAILLGKAALWAMLLLTLSGNVKGEVERLWLFLVPPLCALAAAVIQPARRRLWLPLLAMQAVQSILMAVGLAPLIIPLGSKQ